MTFHVGAQASELFKKAGHQRGGDFLRHQNRGQSEYLFKPYPHGVISFRYTLQSQMRNHLASFRAESPNFQFSVMICSFSTRGRVVLVQARHLQPS